MNSSLLLKFPVTRQYIRKTSSNSFDSESLLCSVFTSCYTSEACPDESKSWIGWIALNSIPHVAEYTITKVLTGVNRKFSRLIFFFGKQCLYSGGFEQSSSLTCLLSIRYEGRGVRSPCSRELQFFFKSLRLTRRS
jgi:hypothetical protein